MAAARTHATTRGFCLCHLLSMWHVQGRLGIYLGYYNVSYAPQERHFVCDEQLYVQLMGIGHLLASLAYMWFSQHWIYDQLAFLICTPLFVYSFQLRHHRIRLLNECAAMQATLERVLGAWLCVTLRKESVLALLLPLEMLLLLGWQYKIYYGYQFCFIVSLALFYYLQLLFLGNYLIWLASIYRALNEFLLQHMSSSRVGLLRTMLRQEVLIWPMHQRIISYFTPPLLCLMVSIMLRVYHQLLKRASHNQLSLDRLQLVHLALLLAVLITLLLAAQDLQQQRRHFDLNYLRLEDRVEYFELKSWCLLRHQTMPKPFGLPLLRRMPKPQQKRDVITMLFSSNLPATALRQRTLLLVHLCLGSSHRLQLSLSQLLDYLIKLGYTLLLSLGLHLLQHTHLVISFRSWRSQSNFDANVTETISQVYRWYSYDELD